MIGTALVTVGASISLYGLYHDLQGLRIKEPQAAPKRFLIENHFLAAALTGVGSLLLWAWPTGVAVAFGHMLLVIVVGTVCEKLL